MSNQRVPSLLIKRGHLLDPAARIDAPRDLLLRDGSPSKENASEGYYAAGAAHLANIAYRKGRRMNWDLKSGKVTEG